MGDNSKVGAALGMRHAKDFPAEDKLHRPTLERPTSNYTEWRNTMDILLLDATVGQGNHVTSVQETVMQHAANPQAVAALGVGQQRQHTACSAYALNLIKGTIDPYFKALIVNITDPFLAMQAIQNQHVNTAPSNLIKLGTEWEAVNIKNYRKKGAQERLTLEKLFLHVEDVSQRFAMNGEPKTQAQIYAKVLHAMDARLNGYKIILGARPANQCNISELRTFFDQQVDLDKNVQDAARLLKEDDQHEVALTTGHGRGRYRGRGANQGRRGGGREQRRDSDEERESEDDDSQGTKGDLCHNFLQTGKCRFGKKCRFAHIDKAALKVAIDKLKPNPRAKPKPTSKSSRKQGTVNVTTADDEDKREEVEDGESDTDIVNQLSDGLNMILTVSDNEILEVYNTTVYPKSSAPDYLVSDSGATTHLGDHSDLPYARNLRAVKGKSVMMNHHEEVVTHVGDLTVSVQGKTLTLKDMAFVRRTAFKIFGVKGWLRKQGGEAIYRADTHTLLDEAGKTIFSIECPGVLYTIPFQRDPVTGDQPSTALVTSQLVVPFTPPVELLRVHRALAHSSLAMIQTLVRMNRILVRSASLKQLILSIRGAMECMACALAKSTTVPYKKALKVDHRVAPEVKREAVPALKPQVPASSIPGGQILSWDVKGPLVESVGRNKFCAGGTIVDTGQCFPTFVRTKAAAADKLKQVIMLYNTRHADKPIKAVRLDGGGENHSTELHTWLAMQGITIQMTAPGSSKQNMQERHFRDWFDGAQANMIHSNLPRPFWPYAVMNRVDVANALPNATRGGSSPDFLANGTETSFAHLLPFGCEVVVRVSRPQENKTALQGRGKRGTYLGRAKHTVDAIYYINATTGRVNITRNYKPFPDVFPYHKTRTETATQDLQPLAFEEETVEEESGNPPHIEPNEEETTVFVDGLPRQAPPAAASVPSLTATSLPLVAYNPQPPAPLHHVVPHQQSPIIAQPAAAGAPDQGLAPARADRPRRVRAQPATFDPGAYDAQARHDAQAKQIAQINHVLVAHMSRTINPQSDEPTTEEALSGPEAPLWDKSMVKEVADCESRDTWDWVDELPKGKKAIPSKFAHKKKRDAEGKVKQHKSRFCAKGCNQTFGIDYFETYAPTPRWDSLRFVFAAVLYLQLALRSLDVNNAYLMADIEEEVYLKPPSCFPNPKGKFMRLKKCLYGLKQSGRRWNAHLTASLRSLGFAPTSADPCLYIRTDGSLALIAFYVDDIIVAAEPQVADALVRAIGKIYPIKDQGPLSWFLSCKVEYIVGKHLRLSQQAYAQSIVAKAGMTQCKPISSPMDAVLPSQEEEEISVDEENLLREHDVRKLYPSHLGAAWYLALCSRPDILYCCHSLSRFMSNPRWKHWKALKRLFRYLSGTTNLALEYKFGVKHNNFELVGFSDADWAGDRATRKSTTGYCFTLGGALISWKTSAQTCIALSTAEAELVALTKTAQHAIWLQRLANNLGFDIRPLTIYEDNEATIAIVKSDPKFNERTKHIEIKYFFVREKIAGGDLEVKYIGTDHQIADIFTKALMGAKFAILRARLGMVYV